jgi:hypothetical protein
MLKAARSRYERLAWFGVVAPAAGIWAFMIVLLAFPRTPSIIFQVLWAGAALGLCISFVIVLIRGDKRSKMIAAIGMAMFLVFVAFVALAVFAIRAAFSP